MKVSATASSGPTMGGGGMGNSTPPTPYTGGHAMPTGFNIGATFRHAIDLVKSPASVMTAYRDADVPINSVLIYYVAVLAVLTLVGTLIGDLIIYRGLYGFFAGYAVGHAILSFILDIIGVFVIGFVVWKLGPNFRTSTNQVRATRLAAYAYTPFFLASILYIIPFVGGILAFLGLLYGLYILYLGLPIMLGTPQEQAITYVIVSVIVVIVVYAVLAAIAGAILLAAFGLGFGLGYIF
ncbi:MAG: YIP1 family protein [Thaumarchaeota archaeon]|nr:YIP1 family protein [Nitrososphaerota archaeon]